MLELKQLRTDPEKARKGYQDRGGRCVPALDELLVIDKAYLSGLKEVEQIRAQQNAIAKDFAKVKAAGGDLDELRKRGEAFKARLAELDGTLKENEAKVKELLLGLPNLPHPTCPVGKSPEDNPVVSEDVAHKRSYDFTPKDHHALGEALGILDFEAAGRLSGARFAVLKGAGARLERALGQFLIDVATRENGYTEVAPPYLVTAESLTGTGQLPKFEEDQYKTAPDGLYLSPTSEVQLSNLHRGQSLDEKSLPLKYTALTACFRREAGSYGKDTRGLIRQHQFNKVELVWLTKPEDSQDALQKLVKDAAGVLSRLELPHRIIELCTADIGFSSCKTYDLEVWMPGENKWREISSCSDCWDFQARRLGTRVRRPDGKTELVHTLNGSGVAVGRLFAAVLENYQRQDGSIEMPKALRPYFGADSISKG